MTGINIIKETLIEELDRTVRSRRAYELECAKLPRCSIHDGRSKSNGVLGDHRCSESIGSNFRAADFMLDE